MQRVVQRTQRAIRVAERRAAKKKAQKTRDEIWSERRGNLQHWQLVAQSKKHQRERLHEAWERGPLTSRVDVGSKALTYGAMQTMQYNLPVVEPKLRPKWWHIAEGDRVTVIEGRDKGKIGVVLGVNEKTVAVKVKDLNRVYVAMPEYMKNPEYGADVNQDTGLVEQEIPLANVRLVYPMPDPQTKQLRDVVIDRVERVSDLPAGDPVEAYFKRQRQIRVKQRKGKETEEELDDTARAKALEKAKRGYRAIAGTNMIIPWPEEAEEEYDEYPDDTKLADRDEETFQPPLLMAPMPTSLIDELRNKYSRFRTRHDYDFVAAREAEDAKVAARAELMDKMMSTPQRELAALRREKAAEAAERKKFTDEQLAVLGELVLKAREQASEGEGVDVSSVDVSALPPQNTTTAPPASS